MIKQFWLELNEKEIDRIYDYNQRGFLPKVKDIHVIEAGPVFKLLDEVNQLLRYCKVGDPDYPKFKEHILNKIKEVRNV